MRALTLSASFLLATTSFGCGVLTHARPTPKGTVALEAGAGGPIANLGVPIPLPLSTVGASYGFADSWDVQAHVHLTPLFLFKTAGFDLGATYLLMQQANAVPAVALSARVYAFTDFHTGILPYADLSATASWQLWRILLGYASVTALLPYDGRLTVSPAAGASVELGRFTLQAELRWYDPSYSTSASFAPWVSPGGLGALGLLLGVGFRL